MTAKHHWLVLADATGLTGATLAAFIDRFGDAAAFASAREGELRAAGAPDALVASLLRPDAARIAGAGDWLGRSATHHLVAWTDPLYPPLLRSIPDPPVALFVRGDPACLREPQLAIVGSRSASAGGAETARAFATHLARRGLVITSGLALGIDTAAHRGALEAGRTVAVLGTGPDVIYPSQNAALAAQIEAGGAICSEFLPGMPPLRENFPRRNRIISGLAAGTLVVEARVQSGALITAHRAIEQGREVFAIPGSIHNPLSKGCHRLIREGAKLVESVDHVLEELPALLSVATVATDAVSAATPASSDRTRDPDYARLLDALGWDTVDLDSLALRSGLTAGEVSSMLLILELEGSVLPLPGGKYQRQKDRQR